LHTKVANIRKDFVHQVSNHISKNHVVVCIEDLQVQNISKSATKKVAQKSGMNRSILDASPFELRRQLEYKTQWQGGLLVPVPPQNTSRKCPECGHISAENRKSQAKFVCVEGRISRRTVIPSREDLKSLGKVPWPARGFELIAHRPIHEPIVCRAINFAPLRCSALCLNFS